MTSKRRNLSFLGCMLHVICLMGVFLIYAPNICAEDFPSNPMEKPGWILDRHDEFNGSTLDESLWIPRYLESRVERERSEARYIFRDGKLVLFIDEDTLSYRPNEQIWVSGIQTGAKNYIHLDDHHHDIEEDIKYAPKYGYFEVRVKSTGSNISDGHDAFWSVGIRNEPWQELEFDISERFNPSRTKTLMNVHTWGDTNGYYSTTNYNAGVDLTSGFNIFALEWDEEEVKFYCNNKLAKTYDYSPNYAMVFFLSLYQYRVENPTYQEYEIDYFRAYTKDPNYVPDDSTQMIVNVGDEGYGEVGNWAISSLVGYSGRHSKYSNTGINDGGKSMWTPNLKAGSYEVSVWYPQHATSTQSATYEIIHADGSSQVTIDQSQNGAEWVSLGSYNFDDGDTGKVILHVNGQGEHRASAVMFAAPSQSIR